jgi:outer membrane protein assembly factor BamB
VDLLYLRARWYDPATGRFLTRDPFPGLASLPQTQHAYVYVGNNPVNLTDPSGRYGKEVHYRLTYELVRQEVLRQGFSGTYAGYLAERIAAANQGVDNWGRDNSLWSRMHWYTRSEAEALLEAAVRNGDPAEFGRALHALQDYYSHRRQGYTIPGGLVGVGIYLNDCISHGEEFGWAGLALSYLDYGHGFSKVAHRITFGVVPDTDAYMRYSFWEERGWAMREETQEWVARFLEIYLRNYPFLGGQSPAGSLLTCFVAPVVSLLVQGPDEPSPDDWPMEGRDPQHTNANPGVIIPPEPNIRWRRALGVGGIWASPVVAGGVVYVGSHNDYLYALDAITGRRLWRFRGGGACAAPAVADGVVYLSSVYLGGDGSLYALDVATGQLLWEYGLGYNNCWDLVAVVNGTIYAGESAVEGNGRIYALGAMTGELKWTFEVENNNRLHCLATDNEVVYVSSEKMLPYGLPEDARLYALDARDGHQLWVFEIREEWAYDGACPVISDGMLYIGSTGRYEQGNWLPAHLYALDAATGELRWRFHLEGDTVKTESLLSPAVSDGVVYVVAQQTTVPGSDDFEQWSTVYALDSVTGDVLWSSQIGPGYGQVEIPPTVAGGQVYIGTGWGWVFALDATTGDPVWRLDVGRGNGIGNSPVVVNEAMYVISTNQVYAIGSPMESEGRAWWPCSVLAFGFLGGIALVLVMLGRVIVRKGRRRSISC